MTNMLKTAKPTDDEMDVVFYEVQMMNRAFAHLHHTSTDSSRNAFLESFLLHLRNLYYFFPQPASSNTKKRPKRAPDDLTYADFRDQKGDTLNPILHKLTKNELNAINKHLQHMTKVRLQQKISWPSALLLQEINGAIGHFLNQVADSYFPTKSGRTREDFLREFTAPTVSTKMVRLPVSSNTSTTVDTAMTILSHSPGKVAGKAASSGSD